ncbi:MAG: NADH-quinone oxidoreductase subunit N [Acidimicrobiales bacterium]|nr:NADH-quinone oxidoreductase subunit N [Acidimicrobiales bacterium]
MGSLLALLSQPLDDAPTEIARVDVAWSALAPILFLIGGAMVLLLGDALTRLRSARGAYAIVATVSALAAAISALPLWSRIQDADRGPFSTLGEAVGVDGFSLFATFVICAAVVLGALLLDGWLRREGMEGPEPYVLTLLSASGGVMMASANDLIVMFLGLEILSIAVYVLAAMHLRKITSQEAGVKYFVLGAFASAFFLYGIAMTYGATGSTNLVDISAFLSTTVLTDSGLLLAGAALLLVGFAFKVAAVPFHFWTPDVYQGAPSPTVAWMASGVKVAGFAGLLRVFYLGFGSYQLDWQPIVYAIAAITMVAGSVLAIVQTDVRRMLAYSSINHAGFVLVGVQAASEQGVEAALFYLAAYTFMVAGSFGVITVITRRGDVGTGLDDLRGLSRDRPLLALTFALFLLAQAGVPLTSGFFAKFYVITAAVDAGSTWLAVIAMVSAVVAAFLYLRIIVSMYMTSDDELPESRSIPVPLGAGVALALSVVVTIGAGIFPGLLSDRAEDATPVLVREPDPDAVEAPPDPGIQPAP